jgi:hypothetical protein
MSSDDNDKAGYQRLNQQAKKFAWAIVTKTKATTVKIWKRKI